MCPLHPPRAEAEQARKEREAEERPDMKEVGAGLEKLFGLRTEGASPHEIALAVGLVVAGQKEGLQAADGDLDRAGLLEGVRKKYEQIMKIDPNIDAF